jgi:hypothetical protein
MTIDQHERSLHQPTFCELLPVRGILHDVIVRTTGAFVAGYELSGISQEPNPAYDRRQPTLGYGSIGQPAQRGHRPYLQAVRHSALQSHTDLQRPARGIAAVAG